MLEHYRVFAKNIKPLPPEPELSVFYHPSENKKNGEVLFVVVGTGIALQHMPYANTLKK